MASSQQGAIALLSYYDFIFFFVWLQAPLIALAESPQQLAHVSASGDPEPCAPAGAQPPREPVGGALRQGAGVRPPLATGAGRANHHEQECPLLAARLALPPAQVLGPGQQVPQPQMCRSVIPHPGLFFIFYISLKACAIWIILYIVIYSYDISEKKPIRCSSHL